MTTLTNDDNAWMRDFFVALRDAPLEPSTDRGYVPLYRRPDMQRVDPVQELLRKILWNGPRSTQLLAGQRGTGKTTELRRLRDELRAGGATVVIVDADSYLDMSAPIGAFVFLTFLAGAFGEALVAEGVLDDRDLDGGFWPRAAKLIWSIDRQPHGTTDETEPMFFESNLGAASDSLKRRIREDRSFRAKLQRRTEAHLELLKREVNTHFAELISVVRERRSAPEARVVCLVDSIEHFDGTPANGDEVKESLESLFVRHESALRFDELHIVLATPAWLQVRNPAVGTRYDGIQTLTAIPVAEKDSGEPFLPGLEALEAIVAARGDWKRLLGGAARLDALIKGSGGHIRDLLWLVREVLVGADSLPASDVAFNRPITKLKHASLATSHDDAVKLAMIHATRRLPTSAWGTADVERLLDTHLVLAYRDARGGEWYDVQPLIVDEVIAQAASAATHPNVATPSRPTLEHVAQLEALRIAGLRGFDAFELAFAPRRNDLGQWVVLLGENGVGKSTILRAIAFALAEEAHASAALATSTVGYQRSPPESASIELRVNGSRYAAAVDVVADLEVVRQPLQARLPVPFLVAYGCQRGSALGGPERDLDFDPPHHIETLFNDTRAGLLHAESWLKSLRHAALDGADPEAPAILDTTLAVLRAMLPGVSLIDVRPDRVWVTGEQWGRCPLAALSDGYLTNAGWIVDLMARWIHARRKAGQPVPANFPETMTGVVLLDEIDLHMHPRWQMQAIRAVRESFPKLTFVVTTHNALTLHGAREGEVYVLRRDQDGRVQAKQVDVPHGIRAEDVLTGVWFGLTSTTDPETLELFERHQKMMRGESVPPGPTLAETEAELRRRLGRFADTSLERSALQVVARLRANAPPNPTPEERQRLLDDAVRLLAEEAEGSGAAS